MTFWFLALSSVFPALRHRKMHALFTGGGLSREGRELHGGQRHQRSWGAGSTVYSETIEHSSGVGSVLRLTFKGCIS